MHVNAQAKREAAAAAAAALKARLAYIDPEQGTALAESIRERAAEAFEEAKDWQPAGLRVLEDALLARVQVPIASGQGQGQSQGQGQGIV